METNGHITYRILPPEEWDKLQHLHSEATPVPSPQFSVAVVAERHGEIVGVLFLQQAVHAEPLVKLHLDVEYRKLFQVLDEEFPGICYFAQAPDDKMRHIASTLGMRELPGVLCIKEH